jgi:DNA-binding HxlR family transcriptional regulator
MVPSAMARSEPVCCAVRMALPKLRLRVLSRELKALTEQGLIDRRDYGVVPPKVEYRLTRKGKSFVPVIASIRNWGTRHLAQASVVEMAAAE